ncbi:oligosaccharide flippase family protein [Alteromonas mediterranea]|uniref:oligosaccharide flippase family protein n=1 Tax=Alteromonas mediterranea TaxID=314275 RepID=UPI0032B19450
MSLASSVLKSSGFMVFGSLFQKSAGLISTLILARLLLPEDFGKVAFLALTVNFFNVLSITGTQQYILSKENIDEKDLNTAISLDLLMKGAFWFVLVCLSTFICEFFNMEDAHTALLMLSLTILIKASRNPGFYLHQKELNYKLLFQVELTAKVLSVVVVIFLAFLYQSYWAIVIGDLISSVVLLYGSYKLHNFRPKFSLERIKVQWTFSKWLFFKGVIGYSKSNLDQMFVTKNFDAATTGSFYMARDIALMPAFDFLNKALAPLLPAFAYSQNDDEMFNYKISFAIFFVNILAFPIAALMIVASDSIIVTLLGKDWIGINDVFTAFIPLMYLACLAPIFAHALVSRQVVKVTFWTDVLALFMHVLSFVLLSNITLFDIIGIRSVALLVSILVLITALYSVSKFLPFRALLSSLFPLIAAVLSYLAIDLSLSGNPGGRLLFIKTVSFGMLYGSITLTFGFIFKNTKEVKGLQLLFNPLLFKTLSKFQRK